MSDVTLAAIKMKLPVYERLAEEEKLEPQLVGEIRYLVEKVDRIEKLTDSIRTEF